MAIVDFVRGVSEFAPLFALTMLLSTDDGSTWSLPEYSSWLLGAGLERVRCTTIRPDVAADHGWQACGPEGPDMSEDPFLESAARVAEWISDYRSRLPELPVLPDISPGDTLRLLPTSPPEGPESLEQILSDMDRIIVPGLTHWNHPGFLAYFSSSSSDPGVLAEFISAALNVNAMLWKTAPSASELEIRMIEWIRRFVGLPDAFEGVIQDTASSSSFTALLAARERALPGSRGTGLAAGQPGARPVVYQSDQAHSSIDKAVIASGIGIDNLRRIRSDTEFRMRPDLLERALESDRTSGHVPVMVCATIGTTSSTSVDPVREIAEICGRPRRLAACRCRLCGPGGGSSRTSAAVRGLGTRGQHRPEPSQVAHDPDRLQRPAVS